MRSRICLAELMVPYLHPFCIVFLSCVIMISCVKSDRSGIINQGDKAKDALVRQIHAAADKENLKLNDLLNFQWDKLTIVKPYGDSPARIDNMAGKYITRSRISERDDICILVFSQAGKTVAICEIERKIGDFSSLKQNQYERVQAIFTIDREAGWIRIIE